MTAIEIGIKKISNILSREQTEILETAFFLMLPALLTKVTGLLFNLIAASYFGTDDAGWNQFLVANAIPEMLTNVLIIGSIGSIVIPTFVTAKKKSGKESFLVLYSSIINIAIILFSIFAFVLIITADWLFPFLLKIIGTDYHPDHSEVGLMINMMRVLLLPQIILGASVFVASGLNVYNRYIVPQLAPLFYNVGRIFCMLTILPLMNFSPWALVVGVIIGSILHLGIQIPLAIRVGLQYKFVIDLKSPYLKELFLVGLPRVLALASEHIALTFNKFLSLAVNGLAAFTYANSLSLIIPTLFGYTFAVPSYTVLSELFEEKNNTKAQMVIIKTINQIVFFALPFIIAILILRVPLTRLAFGIVPGTRLDLEGTYQIAWILLWFAVGHLFVCGKWFMYRVFYAVKDTMVPFFVSTFTLFLTIILSILFTNLLSHSSIYAVSNIKFTIDNLFVRGSGDAAIGGVALAMSLAYTVEFFLMLIIFNYKHLSLSFGLLLKTVFKKIIAGTVMFFVMYLIYKVWNALSYTLPVSVQNGYTGSTTINLIILTSITVFFSFLVYFLISLLLKIEELKILKKYLNPIFKFGGLRID